MNTGLRYNVVNGWKENELSNLNDCLTLKFWKSKLSTPFLFAKAIYSKSSKSI